MRLLLDTHTLLWAASDRPKLSATSVALIEDPNNERWVSVASLWEISIKFSSSGVCQGQRRRKNSVV